MKVNRIENDSINALYEREIHINKGIDRALRNITVFHSIIVLYEREIHIHHDQCPSLFLFGASGRRNTAYPLSSMSPVPISVSAYPRNLG